MTSKVTAAPASVSTATTTATAMVTRPALARRFTSVTSHWASAGVAIDAESASGLFASWSSKVFCVLSGK